MTKNSYSDAKNKKAVREFLFSFFSKNSIIGLAGPDINDYITWCKKFGYDKVEIWENEQAVVLKQLSDIKTKLPITYKFGDIINAEPRKDSTYDLDFCNNITNLYAHVKKFKEQKFVMTFAVRPIGNEETIRLFFKTRKEKIMSRIEKFDPVHHYVIKTAFGKYIVAAYFDTSAMISIAKI
jgi:hypothetical protein